jgi:hypothetical protein
MGTTTLQRAIFHSAFAALVCATAIHAGQDQQALPVGNTSTSELSTTLEVPAATPAPQQEPDEKSKATAAAQRLLTQHFNQRYSCIGERIVISMNLDAPEQVQGWPGRWRFNGTAILRHYRDTSSDELMRKKELEIRETPGLNAKEKYRLVERASFLRAENVAFEACVTGTGPDATLDFTLR